MQAQSALHQTSMSDLPQVAIAILYRQDQFLLQLRDNIPNIAYPGHWGFFGGHLDPGTTGRNWLFNTRSQILWALPGTVGDAKCICRAANR
jgi:hypothetical protein